MWLPVPGAKGLPRFDKQEHMYHTTQKMLPAAQSCDNEEMAQTYKKSRILRCSRFPI